MGPVVQQLVEQTVGLSPTLVLQAIQTHQKTHNSHLWMVSATTETWMVWHKVWETQNGVVHGHDSKKIVKEDRGRAERERTKESSKRNLYDLLKERPTIAC